MCVKEKQTKGEAKVKDMCEPGRRCVVGKVNHYGNGTKQDTTEQNRTGHDRAEDEVCLVTEGTKTLRDPLLKTTLK